MPNLIDVANTLSQVVPDVWVRGIAGPVMFIFAVIMGYASFRLYKMFPYASSLFLPLYMLSGLVMTRSLLVLLTSIQGSSLLIEMVLENLLVVSFGLIVYMFLALRGKILQIFQPYRTAVLVSGLPKETRTEVSVDLKQILSVEPERSTQVDLNAGVHTVRVPQNLEVEGKVYECGESTKKVKPGINIVSFTYRAVVENIDRMAQIGNGRS
ncbi:MAG: hypothetical protein HYU39_01945 [Thaumarchaeota archaeon]|nr:hypothetical protein [Nitrososphaerota archaeon]